MNDPTLPEPFVPADAELRDFPYMPLEVGRLRDSDLAAEPDAEVFRANIMSWCAAWHQQPAGSLPDDDKALAKLLGYGRDLRAWRSVRADGGLRHWVRCADGRLYHRLVCVKVLEAWIAKLLQRKSSGAGNAKRWGVAFDEDAILASLREAAERLERLDPDSEALKKLARMKIIGTPENGPTGTENTSHRDVNHFPENQATGNARKTKKSDPTGTENTSHRDKNSIPPGQENDPTGNPEWPETRPKREGERDITKDGRTDTTIPESSLLTSDKGNPKKKSKGGIGGIGSEAFDGPMPVAPTPKRGNGTRPPMSQQQADEYACSLLAPHVQGEWATVLAAEDPGDPNHDKAVTLCLKAAKAHGIGWVSPEKREERRK